MKNSRISCHHYFDPVHLNRRLLWDTIDESDQFLSPADGEVLNEVEIQISDCQHLQKDGEDKQRGFNSV